MVLANDSELGLCSSVWTADSDRAGSVARRLEAGYTYPNNHGPLSQDGRAPFGGFKMSGIGRNLGFEGILGFTESHSITRPGGFLFRRRPCIANIGENLFASSVLAPIFNARQKHAAGLPPQSRKHRTPRQ